MQNLPYGSNTPSLENEKSVERIAFLKTIFETFQQKYRKEMDVEIEFYEAIDVVVEEVNQYYWEFVAFIKEEKYVVNKENESESPKLNIYKIISATELSIIKIQPIRGSRRINAALAFTTAMSFYRIWFQKDLKDASLAETKLGDIWSKFLEDHQIWLTNLDTSYSFPYFLNSQVWMLVDLLTRNNIPQD